LNIEDIVANKELYSTMTEFIQRMAKVTYSSHDEFEIELQKCCKSLDVYPKTRLYHLCMDIPVQCLSCV